MAAKRKVTRKSAKTTAKKTRNVNLVEVGRIRIQQHNTVKPDDGFSDINEVVEMLNDTLQENGLVTKVLKGRTNPSNVRLVVHTHDSIKSAGSVGGISRDTLTSVKDAFNTEANDYLKIMAEHADEFKRLADKLAAKKA